MITHRAFKTTERIRLKARRGYYRHHEMRKAKNRLAYAKRCSLDPDYQARLKVRLMRRLIKLLRKRSKPIAIRQTVSDSERRQRRLVAQKRYRLNHREAIRRKKKNFKRGRILKTCLERNQLERFMHHRKRLLIQKRRIEARKKGIEFTINPDDLIWPTNCPALGLEIDYITRGKLLPNMPSIDRIDPKKGYVPGNVAVISFRANTIKNNATPEELESVARYIRQSDFWV